MWSDLELPWQACLEEAWAAYCNGSYPIGAVIIDGNGTILACGRNHIKDSNTESDTITENQLAHAEINALIKISHLPKSVLHQAKLYSSLEPCPLCMGALYMSAVRNIYFAARDAHAGSTNLLGKTLYLSRKPIQVHPPTNDELESISTAICIAHALLENWKGIEVFLDTQREILPSSVDYGCWLHSENWLPRMRKEKRTAKEMYENLVFQRNDFMNRRR
jgi:tRNA(adenine34) deaminase